MHSKKRGLGEKMNLSFLAGVKYKNIIYFSAMHLNALFSFDCNTHETKFISCFEKEEPCEWLHRYAYCYGDAIWFIPWGGKYISKYCMQDQRIEYYSIPEFDGYTFLDPILFSDRYLFLIPCGFNMKNLIRIDMDESTVMDCGKVLKGVHTICAGAYIHNNLMYFVSADGEVCSTYSLTNGTNESREIDRSEAYQSMVKIGNKCFVFPLATSNIKVFDIMSEKQDVIISEGNYYNCMIIGKKVWVFPFDTNRKLLCLPLEKGGKTCFTKDIDLKIDKGRWLYVKSIMSDDSLYWVTTSFGELWKVDEDFEIKDRIRISLSEDENDNLINEKIIKGIYFSKDNPVINETELMTLSGFLKAVKECK